jgi:phosphate starvation-inducible protein PhoH and related proteins
MSKKIHIVEAISKQFKLRPDHPRSLAILCGQFNENLNIIGEYFDVTIKNRGHLFEILGAASNVTSTANIIKKLYSEITTGTTLNSSTLHLYLQECDTQTHKEKNMTASKSIAIQTPKLKITPRGENQTSYVDAIHVNTINFGIGPAGTGKTYLAVACAVEALKSNQVERILLVRPAVEAGEKLGFLPGDLTQKIDPYLRPLYDALYEMLGFDTTTKLIEKNIIEVAPLAFMRGRTLSQAFIILDESQNTTASQMKMFLTRIGAGTKAVITGDMTQTDLTHDKISGLTHAQYVLKHINGIHFTNFQAKDVIRHPLVKAIVQAYEKKSNSSDAP